MRGKGAINTLQERLLDGVLQAVQASQSSQNDLSKAQHALRHRPFHS